MNFYSRRSGFGIYRLDQRSKVRVAFSWNAAEETAVIPAGVRRLDLDASCLLMGHGNELVDTIWFRNRQSPGKAVIHGGDEDIQMEKFHVNLGIISSDVKSMVFAINALGEESFANVKNCRAAISGIADSKEIGSLSFDTAGDHKAFLMFSLRREADEWNIVAIGREFHGRTLEETAAAAALHA
jgi:stress response protein SCP2